MANGDILVDSSGLVRRHQSSEAILRYGDPPPAPPDPPVPYPDDPGWYTIGYNISSTGGYGSGATQVSAVQGGGYVQMPLPPHGSSIYPGCNSYDLWLRVQSHTRQFPPGEDPILNFSCYWDYDYSVVSNFTIPYFSLGPSTPTALRATGVFAISLQWTNFIYWDTLTSSSRPMGLSYNILGASFDNRRVGNDFSGGGGQTRYVFSNSALAAHLNTCIVNESITPFPTSNPYLTCFDAQHDLQSGDWLDTTEGGKTYYYPPNTAYSAYAGSHATCGIASIQGYFL